MCDCVSLVLCWQLTRVCFDDVDPLGSKFLGNEEGIYN